MNEREAMKNMAELYGKTVTEMQLREERLLALIREAGELMTHLWELVPNTPFELEAPVTGYAIGTQQWRADVLAALQEAGDAE